MCNECLRICSKDEYIKDCSLCKEEGLYETTIYNIIKDIFNINSTASYDIGLFSIKIFLCYMCHDKVYERIKVNNHIGYDQDQKNEKISRELEIKYLKYRVQILENKLMAIGNIMSL